MKLTDRFDDVLSINGLDFKLNLYFDVVLRCRELERDPAFNNIEKLEILFEMLVDNNVDYVNLSIHEKSEIVQLIFNLFILSDSEEGRTMIEDNETPKKIYDFEQDAEAIYASFLFDYGIDLVEHQGKLHWKKFIALLNGLSDKSAFKQILRIRTMEVPVPNKYNQKERQMILKMKRAFSLEQGEQSADELDKKFDQLATMLRPSGGEKK